MDGTVESAARRRSRFVGYAALVGLAVAVALPDAAGAQQRRSIFMGGNPESVPSDDVNTSRLRFPAGVRSNWHTHTDGQLLMLESGRALTQVRGGPLLEMHAGEPWWTPAGVEHWHGAHPDEESMQLTIYAGTVNWLEPVTDAVYRAPPRRP